VLYKHTPLFGLPLFFQASNQGSLNGNKIPVLHAVSWCFHDPLEPKKSQEKPRAYNGITNKFISHHWQSKKECSETRVTMTARKQLSVCGSVVGCIMLHCPIPSGTYWVIMPGKIPAQEKATLVSE